MTDNKNTIFGWILFSGIIALGLSIVSGKVFHADNPEAPEKPGLFIEAAEEGAAGPGEMSIEEALNTLSQDELIAAGENVFAKCTACHTIDQGGATGIGPNLYGIMGKGIASGSFAYSGALADKGGNWDWASMSEWLKNPKAFANGTKMSFAGLSKIEDRAAVMMFMNSKGSNLAVPEYVAPEPTEGEDGATDGEAGVEGGTVDPVEASEAMDMAQPVPSQGGGTTTN